MRSRMGLLLVLLALAVPALATTIDARAALDAPNPLYGETSVNVKGTHSAQITDLDQVDSSYPWFLAGKLYEKSFLVLSEEDNCSAEGGASLKPSLSCQTTYAGACDRTYMAETDASLEYPFWLGPGPGDQDTTEASPICNVVSTSPREPLTDSCRTGSCTPIVIDLDGSGFRFTDLEDGVSFDVDADGEAERLSWTAPSAREAFLVLDRDGNGRIDDGSELFGGAAPQPDSDDPNGFAALRVFDQPAEGGDGDGFLSSADSAYDRLELWIDADHDGVSQASEIVSLAAEGIQWIDLTPAVSERRDRYGNLLRWVSRVALSHGRQSAAVDVLFLVEP